MRAPNTRPSTKKTRNLPPKVRILNRQNKHRLPIRLLRKQTELTLEALGKAWPLSLRELDIVIVGANESGRIHAEFLDDPAPTDVISFEHGELIICPEVAEQQRHIEGLTLIEEILTYIIHGCLHLCGYDDHSDNDFHRMRRKQTQVRNRVLAQLRR